MIALAPFWLLFAAVLFALYGVLALFGSPKPGPCPHCAQPATRVFCDACWKRIR